MYDCFYYSVYSGATKHQENQPKYGNTVLRKHLFLSWMRNFFLKFSIRNGNSTNFRGTILFPLSFLAKKPTFFFFTVLFKTIDLII